MSFKPVPNINNTPSAIMSTCILPYLIGQDLQAMERVSKKHLVLCNDQKLYAEAIINDFENTDINYALNHIVYKSWTNKNIYLLLSWRQRERVKKCHEVALHWFYTTSSVASGFIGFCRIPLIKDIRYNLLVNCSSEISEKIRWMCRAACRRAPDEPSFIDRFINSPYCQNYWLSRDYCESIKFESDSIISTAYVGIGIIIGLTKLNFIAFDNDRENTKWVRITNLIGGSVIAGCGGFIVPTASTALVGKLLIVSGSCFILKAIGINPLHKAVNLTKYVSDRSGVSYVAKKISSASISIFSALKRRLIG